MDECNQDSFDLLVYRLGGLTISKKKVSVSSISSPMAKILLEEIPVAVAVCSILKGILSDKTIFKVLIPFNPSHIQHDKNVCCWW